MPSYPQCVCGYYFCAKVRSALQTNLKEIEI